jgi:hypothetical protein
VRVRARARVRVRVRVCLWNGGEMVDTGSARTDGEGTCHGQGALANFPDDHQQLYVKRVSAPARV